MNATQGPWEITSEPDNEHPVYDIGHRHQDGSVLLVCETISSRQAEDARLIAAAPELLAALQEIYDHCDPANGNARAAERAYDSLQIARAAIAKAKGAAPNDPD